MSTTAPYSQDFSFASVATGRTRNFQSRGGSGWRILMLAFRSSCISNSALSVSPLLLRRCMARIFRYLYPLFSFAGVIFSCAVSPHGHGVHAGNFSVDLLFGPAADGYRHLFVAVVLCSNSAVHVHVSCHRVFTPADVTHIVNQNRQHDDSELRS